MTYLKERREVGKLKEFLWGKFTAGDEDSLQNSRSNHIIGDWVLGRKCIWNGTYLKEDAEVPACTNIVPGYRFGGNYRPCSEKCGVMTEALYTVQQIKFFVRLYMGYTSWLFPMRVTQFADVILLKETGTPTREIASRMKVAFRDVQMLLNNPIMRVKYPFLYKFTDPDLIANTGNISAGMVEIMKRDKVFLGISEDSISEMFFLPIELVRELLHD